LGWDADIRWDGDGFASPLQAFSFCRLQAFSIPGCQYQPGSLLGKLVSEFPSNAARGAGDNHDFILEGWYVHIFLQIQKAKN
jgi:hypothetical protein